MQTSDNEKLYGNNIIIETVYIMRANFRYI